MPAVDTATPARTQYVFVFPCGCPRTVIEGSSVADSLEAWRRAAPLRAERRLLDAEGVQLVHISQADYEARFADLLRSGCTHTEEAAVADELPPTQYLVLEVLAARYRLGETYWTFPNRLRPTVDRLADAGLVWRRSGPAEGAFEARLTDDGIKEALGAGYVAPVAAAETRGYAEAVQALRSEDRWLPWCDEKLDPNDPTDWVRSTANTFAAAFLEAQEVDRG